MPKQKRQFFRLRPGSNRWKERQRRVNIDRLKSTGLKPLIELFKEEIQRREKIWNEKTSKHPEARQNSLWGVYRQQEYGLMVELLNLLYRREIKAFLFMLMGAEESSRIYILETWKKDPRTKAWFDRFFKNVDHLPTLIFVGQKYGSVETEWIKIKDKIKRIWYLDAFSNKKERAKHIEKFGIRGFRDIVEFKSPTFLKKSMRWTSTDFNTFITKTYFNPLAENCPSKKLHYILEQMDEAEEQDSEDEEKEEKQDSDLAEEDEEDEEGEDTDVNEED